MLLIRRITVHLTVAVGIAMLFSNGETRAAETADESTTGELALTVQDAAGQTIEHAHVDVFRWTGEYTPTGIEGHTDARGQVHLHGIPVDDYLSIDIEADGFVNKKLSMTFATPSRQELTVKLYPPVESWLEVCSSDGKPVVGAELQYLRYTDADGATFFIDQKLAVRDDLELTPSDERGILRLPSMPADVKLTVSVIHPAWKPSMISEVRSAAGLISSMTLFPGIPVEIVLKPSDQEHPIHDGTSVDVSMMPASGGSFSASTIRHRFEVQGGRIRFAADSVNYESLRAETDQFFIGPLIYNFPDAKFERLDLRKRSESVIEMTSHTKQLVRGRVVDHRGDGVAGVVVSGMLIDQARMRQIDENTDSNASNTNFRYMSALSRRAEIT